MEPQIRYTKTSDGVSIAYFVVGAGPPIIMVGGGFGWPHIQLNWPVTLAVGGFEALLADHSMTFYDIRGTGSSQREITEFEEESLTFDLAAIIEMQPSTPVVLLAAGHGGPTAIRFAAGHPGLVSHLILWNTWADSRSHFGADEGANARAFTDLISTSVSAFARSVARSAVARGQDELERVLVRALAQGTFPEAAQLYYPVLFRDDATEAMGRVRVPTLVLNPARGPYVSTQTARQLAMGIPGAQLTFIEGPGVIPMWGDVPEGVRAIRAFLGDDAALTPQPPLLRGERGSGGGLRIVLFTDIVGHTEMMQRLGDAKGREVLREHERITRELLREHGGAEVKTMGDGFMASFGSVTSAMECAIALQRAFAARNLEPGTESLEVRVGLNAGEPIEEEGDLFGATVILASRIAAKAGAGEILVPETVRGLLSGKGFAFSDRGEFVPKGFDEGVRAWEVRWRE